jgi:urea transport system permease protein
VSVISPFARASKASISPSLRRRSRFAAYCFFSATRLVYGNNGFTDFAHPWVCHWRRHAHDAVPVLNDWRDVAGLLSLLVGELKFGRVLQAVRDAESRVMFCGYNCCPTSSPSGRSGRDVRRGALYVPQVGIINPGEMSTAGQH